MAESRPPGGGPDDARSGGSGATGLGAVPPEVALWLRRWRERLSQDDRGMPEDEARLVIESVLEELQGGHPENLDRAGRAWGRAHRSVSEMVGRLSSFREALAASGVDDPLKMHRALDRVTAAATEEVLHRLEHASRTDALTGVGNRRAFDETLSAAISAASRQGHEITVVAVDLDGLKRINDTEGHAAGDAALLTLVRAFYAALRDEDTVFRVGGDEFVILLPFTSVDAAEVLMERIAGSSAPSFTWGAAGYPGDGSDARHLVEAADADLYRRRTVRRSERVLPARRPAAAVPVTTTAAARASARWSQMSPALRWAWIPAAAVLVVSLIATLLSTSSPNSGIVAKGPGHRSHPVTSPSQGSNSSPSGPNGSNGTGGLLGGPGGNSSGAGFVTVGHTQPSTGQPGNGANPTTTTTAPQPPRQGGVLGLVENLLSPVPVVGGQNGLIATVGQVLTGTPAGPVLTAARPGAASTAATGTGGLLTLVGLAR